MDRSEDGGDEQSAKAHGQSVDDEVGEHVVGLLCYLLGQRCHTGAIVTVERRTDEEEERRHGDEEIASEECRELRRLVGLRGMVALHVVLVDAVVLQVDEDTVNKAYPEGARRQVAGKGSQGELVALGTVDGQFEGLHGTFGHGEHENGQTQQGAAYQYQSLYGVSPDNGLQTSHHRIDDDADRGADNHHVQVPAHEDIHRYRQQVEDTAHAGYLRQQVTG